MAHPTALFFPIEKAAYLFTRKALPGAGGDKQKFWEDVMGFASPENIREALLSSVTLPDLYFQKTDAYGDRYQAVTEVCGHAGVSRWVRTGWIVRHNETIARFVTAVPEKARG
ncbi:MAG: DUF6883 domain-containing protein [Cyanobacteria bacterium J06627_28]